MIRKIFAEPLTHLIAGGLLLFGLYAIVGEDADDGNASVNRTIVVDDALRKRLSADFGRRFGRQPNPEEMKTLVERFIDDEVLVRQAQAQNMSAGDMVIRQRLVQKMRLAIDEGQAARAPSEEEVEAFFKANAKRYERPTKTSIRQVFIDPATAETVLTSLRSGKQRPEQVSKPFARGYVFRRHTDAKLSSIFGPKFVTQLATMHVGTWHGPIQSSYGHHLVVIDQREAGGTRPLEEVRTRVIADLQRQRRQRGKGLEQLRSQFLIERR